MVRKCRSLLMFREKEERVTRASIIFKIKNQIRATKREASSLRGWFRRLINSVFARGCSTVTLVDVSSVFNLSTVILFLKILNA